MNVYCDKSSDQIWNKYTLCRLIAESTFSHVYDCRLSEDRFQETLVAKIIKKKKNYIDQSFKEIEILTYLKKKGSSERNKFIDLRDYFYYNN